MGLPSRPSSPSSNGPTGAPGNSLLFPLLLLLVGAAFLAFRFGREADKSERSPGPPRSLSPRWEGPSVALTVRFGNGATRAWDALPWTEGMTVRDALDRAAQFQPGLTYADRGTGSNVLIVEIDGIANTGDAGKNWIYSVDGEQGVESAGSRKLESGARILWEFEKYD